MAWRELTEQRSALNSQIEEQRRANSELTYQIEALVNDPDEADRAIREVLDLAKPGETIVRFGRLTTPQRTHSAVPPLD